MSPPARAAAASSIALRSPEKGGYVAEALEVLTLEGPAVKEMIAFMTPDVFPRFGLPGMLSPR
jgi:hypothetical protein